MTKKQLLKRIECLEGMLGLVYSVDSEGYGSHYMDKEGYGKLNKLEDRIESLTPKKCSTATECQKECK